MDHGADALNPAALELNQEDVPAMPAHVVEDVLDLQLKQDHVELLLLQQDGLDLDNGVLAQPGVVLELRQEHELVLLVHVEVPVLVLLLKQDHVERP